MSRSILRGRLAPLLAASILAHFTATPGLTRTFKNGEPAATVAGVKGRVQRLPYGSRKITWLDVEKGGSVAVGDTIRTGMRGRVRLEFNDRDDERKTGPSTMAIGPNSEVLVEAFASSEGKGTAGKGLFDLLKGTVQSFFRGSGGKTDSYNIKAGVAICGIRGSKQVVTFDGHGRASQANLDGSVFTRSMDSLQYPGDRRLEKNYQRYMRSTDPSTWVDVKLTEQRKQRMRDQTELDPQGKTEEQRHEETYGPTPGGQTGGGQTGGASGGQSGGGSSTEVNPRNWGPGTVNGPLPAQSTFKNVVWGADELPDCSIEALDVMLNDYAWSDIKDYREFTYYRDELISGRFVVSGDIAGSCPGEIVGIEVSVDGGVTWAPARVSAEAMTFRYAFDPTGYSDLDLQVRGVYDPEVVAAYHQMRGIEE